MANIIEDWCHEMIEGVGGLHDFEYYEMAVPNCDRDVATAMWIVKCLGNSETPETQAVVDAIVERRKGGER